jgi:cytoskeletal protein CcmA (bactofilin family)
VTAAGDKPSTLVVSERARIEGEISVSHLVVNGTVIGPVHSSTFLELQARARVTVDVEYSTIEIQLGAVVQGRLVHQATALKAVELKLAASN